MFLKWRREPIYVAFDTVSTPVHKVPFPAVTVCNMNQASLDRQMHKIKYFSKVLF